jgi:hypothetical protein
MFSNKLPSELTLNDHIIMGREVYPILELIEQETSSGKRYKIVYKSSIGKLTLFCKLTDELTVLDSKN